MARPCTVCTHYDRPAIDLALAQPAVNLSALAREYDLNRDALRRHREAHLPGLLVDLTVEAEALRGGQIHAQAQEIYRRSLALLHQAEQGVVVGTDSDGLPIVQHSVTTTAKALAEVRKALELLARLALVAPAGVRVGEGGQVGNVLDEALDRAIRAALERSTAAAQTDIEEAEVVSDTAESRALSAPREESDWRAMMDDRSGAERERGGHTLPGPVGLPVEVVLRAPVSRPAAG